MLQGERPMATDNRSVGRFILDGIPPSPRVCLKSKLLLILMPWYLERFAKDKGTGKKSKTSESKLLLDCPKRRSKDEGRSSCECR
nr:hypothetical protein [Okeania hirsuta]